jgi:RHS repeat-associated protein
VTVSNTLARATEAFTDNCTSGKITDEWFGFDADGRLTDFYESTPHSGGYYHTSASYWANGGLNALSGLTSTSTAIFPTIYYGASTGTGLDGEGRITTVNAASGSIPLTGVNYVVSGTTEPIGALTSVTYGSTDGDSFTYDPSTGRPKIYTFTVNGATDKGSLTWNTNGTLSKLVIADSLPGATDTQTCNYFYDDLGRLAGKNTNGYSVDCGASKWQQLFTLDAFGNIAKSGTSSFAATYSTTNQFTVSGVTITYDANGNLLTDNLSNTYTWDANWGNPARVNSTNLIYDALGQMVEQQTGSTSTQMLYSQLGKTALMNGQTLTVAFINLPGGGTAIYNSTGLAYYRHTDWLDSSRLTSTSSRTVSSDLAYAPYGEQYLATGTADPSYTGQNSDTTSSLYDFTFRENSPSQGRWVSPDPSGTAAVDPANPQTWNRYAYVMNNPLTSIDPLGLADLNNINELSSGVYLICNHNPGDREGMSGGDGSYSQIYQYQGGPIQWPNQQLVSCVIVIPGFNSPNQGSSGSADNGTKKQQKKCLSEYNNSAEGKITKFFSLYDAATNWSHVWKEWTLWPGIKVAAATVLKSIGEGVGTTEFLSVTGGASTVVTGPTAAGITAAEGGLAPVTPFVIGASTVLDVAVHVQCALDPSLPANGIPIAPKVVGH